MTTVQQLVSNPFALMIDPESVIAAMVSSDRLARLESRVFRPLDKPMTGPQSEADSALHQEAANQTLECGDALD